MGLLTSERSADEHIPDDYLYKRLLTLLVKCSDLIHFQVCKPACAETVPKVGTVVTGMTSGVKIPWGSMAGLLSLSSE